MRSNSIISVDRNESIRTLTFNVTGAGQVVLHLERVAQANLDRATFHGFTQRISDAAALSRDTVSGQPASPAEKLIAMRELVEWYESGAGEWSRRSTSAKGAVTDRGILLQALSEFKPKVELSALREYVGGLSKAQVQALLKAEQLREIVDRIQAVQAQGIDTEGLLAAI